MSSRVIKKLGLKDLDVFAIKGDSDKDDTLSNLDTQISTFNRYNLLKDESLSESEVNQDGDGITELFDNEETARAVKRDKKRRKKKKKKTKTCNPKYEDHFAGQQIEECGESDEVREYQNEFEWEERMKLLVVESPTLNPSNELKWIFGSKVFNATTEYGSKPRRGRTYQLFKTLLSAPKDNWVSYSKTGLTMSFINTVNGIHYFKYEYSEEYFKVEDALRQFIYASDLDSVLMLVNKNPYHASVLFQIAYICESGDDYALGCELLERALYSLERSFHPSFNLLAANCKLDYFRKENRPLFIGLFKFMLSVAKRSCYKTAWEINKALYALEPDTDPTACILCIDYFTLKARKYKWLLSFIKLFDPIKCLLHLPSFLYSKAIAHYYLDETEQADEQLIDAMLYYPIVISIFISEYSARLDPRIGSHNFFSASSNNDAPTSISFLSILYLERMEQLLKDPTLKKWLESCALRVIAIVDEGVDSRIQKYNISRYNRYSNTIPLNIKRHIVLSGMNGVLQRVRQNIVSFLAYDPVPPPRTPPPTDFVQETIGSNTFTTFFRSMLPSFSEISNTTTNHNSGNNGDVRDMYDAPSAANNGVATTANNNNQDSVSSVIVIENSWRQSVTALIDSVRDLLTSFEIIDNNQDAEHDETDTGDSAANDNNSSS